MEPQVSQVSWRAPYRCTRLLILYLSVVKNELLTRRKGYLIIDIVRATRCKMLTKRAKRFTRDECLRLRSDARREREARSEIFLTRSRKISRALLRCQFANFRWKFVVVTWTCQMFEVFEYFNPRTKSSVRKIFRSGISINIFFNQSIQWSILFL